MSPLAAPSGEQGDRVVRAGVLTRPALPQGVERVLTDFRLAGHLCLGPYVVLRALGVSSGYILQLGKRNKKPHIKKRRGLVYMHR